MRRVDSLEDSDAGRGWGQEEKGKTEDEMAGWHHWLDGRESEWTPGVGDGQGGLACCDSWGHKESDTTEWLNWTLIDLISSYEIGKHLQAFWTWYSQICAHCWYRMLPLLPSGWTLQAEATEGQRGELYWREERAREVWLLSLSFELGFQPGCYKALPYLTFFPRGKWRTLI